MYPMTQQGLRLFVAFIIILVLSTCKSGTTKKNTLFAQLSSKESGIHFSNDIYDDDSTYSFINEFGYMGGGVGIGDFNNDGLKDIFFTGNQVSSRLYINKGNNQFEDITENAGLTTNVWCTGVSIADVNHDGYDDIYVCVFGKNLMSRSLNLLFINQGNLTFKEEAKEYGIADDHFSTQAAFFDYDLDGDLDLYVMNYLLSNVNTNTISARDRSGRALANDRLYRNNGDSLQKGHPVFTDVTMDAGIKEDGYGLGLAISDYNNDGWPDIYVANDFITNDELWLNNKNGTFINCIDRVIQHQSYSSMGTDAGDINNDGLTDVITLDMMPETNQRKKTSFFFMNYERYEAERAIGYEPEFPRNMLHLNNGSFLKDDTLMPFFSEIGQLAGVSQTDWSWSVLLTDFNNDGWKDIHITNGIGRDFINADFLEYSNLIFVSTQSKDEQHKVIRSKLASLKHVNLSNYLYINQRGYSFADSSEAAGIDELSMSNGAVYADLDNDGDQDLVINNINKEAFVFINKTIEKEKPLINHFLRLELKGDSLNKSGFGARVLLYSKAGMQMLEQNPVRGYFSSVDQQLLFGLGKETAVDSIVITWPSQYKQVVVAPAVDTLLVLSLQDAINGGLKAKSYGSAALPALFTDITAGADLVYRHKENSYNDYAIQRLLPQKYSQQGPFITTGDVNNDGAPDFFIGGGFNFSGKLFTQNGQHYQGKNFIDSVKMEEDNDCILFDADSDGDNDLVITSGGMIYEDMGMYYRPRVYFNDGRGNFSLQHNTIHDSIRVIAGCIRAGDYDGDGDLDLFLGGRVSRKYPLAPRSYILQNDKGRFTDVTAKVCPALQRPGMITSAVWIDFDKDKQLDLIVAGEWMPVRFFKGGKSNLEEVTANTGLTQMEGMWRSLVAEDMDNDGDLDLVAGNLGLNCKYYANTSDPMKLYATDLDDNGSVDPVFFYYIKDNDGKRKLFPGISRSQFADQVPPVKKQFLYHADYAHATYSAIFKNKKKENIYELSCDETRSCWLENLGNGKFAKHVLPTEAQFAPVNAILCYDFDNDGIKDILVAGNEYNTDVMTGRYDASYGCFLKGTNKSFSAIPILSSGFRVKGDVRDMALIESRGGNKYVLVAVNNDSLRVFRIKE
jgi:hypothetical protein